MDFKNKTKTRLRVIVKIVMVMVEILLKRTLMILAQMMALVIVIEASYQLTSYCYRCKTSLS